MGKKGAWFSAIKKLFTKHKHPLNENKGKDKRLKHGSLIPLFRKPSSIEQILEEFDQHHLHHPTTQPQPPPPQPQPPQTQPQPPQTQPQSPQLQSPQTQPQPSQLPPQTQPQPSQLPQPHSGSQSQPPQPPPQARPQTQTPQSQTQPQPRPASSSSSSGSPVSPPPQRPQRIASPPRVVHQQPKINPRPEPTLQQRHLSATRIQAVYKGYMARKNVRGLTGLVRLQRVLTSQNVKRQTVNAMKQMQLLVRVQTQIRSQRIQMLKNQALKPQPKANNSPHKQAEMDDEHWDDSLITKEEREARLKRKEEAVIKRQRAMAYAYSHQKGTDHQTFLMGGYPWWWNWLERQQTTPPLKNHQFAATPSRSTPPTTPMSSRSTNRSIKYSKARKGYPMKDDDSLMSCPPFSVPNYMSPTASARAKARPTSNPKERCSTPGSDTSKRRFSFPFTPNTPGSIGDLSMNSVPASVGRKPFNRFV